MVEEFYGGSSEDWDVEVEEDDLSGEGCDLRDEGRLRAKDRADAVGTRRIWLSSIFGRCGVKKGTYERCIGSTAAR